MVKENNKVHLKRDWDFVLWLHIKNSEKGRGHNYNYFFFIFVGALFKGKLLLRLSQ